MKVQQARMQKSEADHLFGGEVLLAGSEQLILVRQLIADVLPSNALSHALHLPEVRPPTSNTRKQTV